MGIVDISHTIESKSDQLNAADIIGSDRIIKITDVLVTKSKDQPVIISYEGGDGRPYKPGLSMRRVLHAIWGKCDWSGRLISLYNDPTVKHKGELTGGIRINKVSHIDNAKNVTVPQSKHKSITYHIDAIKTQEVIKPAELKQWPIDAFNKTLAGWSDAIINGELTAEQAINKMLSKGHLSDDQKQSVRNVGNAGADVVIEEDESGFFNDGVNE